MRSCLIVDLVEHKCCQEDRDLGRIEGGVSNYFSVYECGIGGKGRKRRGGLYLCCLDEDIEDIEDTEDLESS